MAQWRHPVLNFMLVFRQQCTVPYILKVNNSQGNLTVGPISTNFRPFTKAKYIKKSASSVTLNEC